MAMKITIIIISTNRITIAITIQENIQENSTITITLVITLATSALKNIITITITMIPPIKIMSKHWYNFNDDKVKTRNKNDKNVIIVISICGERISITMELNIRAKMAISLTILIE